MRELKARKCKRVHDIHFSPDGRRLLAVGGRELLLVESAVWLDVLSGENVGRIDQVGSTHALSPDASVYVLTGADEVEDWGGIAPVQSINPLDNSSVWAPFPPDDQVEPADRPVFRSMIAMTFDHAGEQAAAVSQRIRRLTDLIVFRPKTAEIVHRIPIEQQDLRVLAFNPEATLIALTGGYDGSTTVLVYDVVRGKLAHRFDPPATVTRSVRFLANGRLAVANGRKVLILPANGLNPERVLSGHKGQVNAIAVTPDGQRILSASHDGGIRLWDVNSDQLAATYDWNIGPITAVKFSPDGLTCAAAGLNGRVIVWDVDT